MSTVRLQIVDAVEARMVALGYVTHRNLDYALEARNLPSVVVRSGPDSEQVGMPGNRGEQTVDVEVKVLIANSINPELDADTHEKAIQAALFADFRLGGLAVSLSRAGGDWEFDLGDCCARNLIYRITYRTAIDNLETVK